MRCGFFFTPEKAAGISKKIHCKAALNCQLALQSRLFYLILVPVKEAVNDAV